MNYCAIHEVDIANGKGVRVSLFVSGCRNHCKGCFQPETWNFDYGQPFTDETKERLLNLLANEYIEGITILGGDPMEPENAPVVLDFLRTVRAEFDTTKNIWLYTGYIFENLIKNDINRELLELCDVVIDGPFIEEKKNLMLPFRGSENQRILTRSDREKILKNL